MSIYIIYGAFLFLSLAGATAALSASFTDTLVVRRTLTDDTTTTTTTTTTTLEQAYQCTLQAWKQNLGLWFVPPPFILNAGDTETGEGFVLMRVPPWGLREGIVGRDVPAPHTLRMTYKVLNPSLVTWPVQDHVEEILFFYNEGGGCELEWTVRWTPLAVWIPYFPELLQSITSFIINIAADYVVSLCSADKEELQNEF